MTARAASECLRRATRYYSARGIVAGWPETPRGSVYESPVRPLPHAPKPEKQRRLSLRKLDLVASFCLRVIDSNPEHWEALIHFFSTCPGAVPDSRVLDTKP